MLFSEILEFVITHRNKGRSGSFDFPNEVLAPYIVWAFQRDYLITHFEEGKLTSILIAAPLNKDFNPEQDKLFSFDRRIEISEEKNYPLGILDFICIKESARKAITDKLITRFDNMLNQDKWASRFGKIVKLPNSYFNHFYHI